MTCDCCQKEIQQGNELDLATQRKIGYLNKVYYCEECLPLYDEYKKQVDAYHDQVSKSVQEGLDKIKMDWLSKHPGATLPE